MAKPTVGMHLKGFKERTYELKGCLGGGGFASVWTAEVRGTGERFAIKIFKVGEALDTVACIERAFGREVQALMDVRDARCPHLVRLEESFKDMDTGLRCIVMTLVAGSPMQDRMRKPYTLADVLRWTRQLATALAHLANLKPEPLVHGDVKPDNLLVDGSSSDFVLGDVGVAMWEGLRAGLRPAKWQLSDNAFVAPERRLAILGPTSRLSGDEIYDTIHELLKKVGSPQLDTWSLGVMTYLLGMRKDPYGYFAESHVTDADLRAKLAEADAVAERADAVEWLQTELQDKWPEASVEDVKRLAEVIAGTIQRLGGRLSAAQVLELLGPTGDADGAEATHEDPAKLRAEYKQQLAEKLKSRPGMLYDYSVSLSAEDVVPLDLLPNHDFLKALTRKDANHDARGDASKPVTLSQLLSGVCTKGLSVIVGPAGAGKTTLLHHLALRLAEADDSEGEVPVIVHAQDLLRTLRAGPEDVNLMMGQVAAAVNSALMTNGYSETLQRIAMHAQRSGKPMLMLLVDGLDEVAESGRHELLQRLFGVQASNGSPFGRVIVSSRPGASSV